MFHRWQQVKLQPSKQQQTSPSRRNASQDQRSLLGEGPRRWRRGIAYRQIHGPLNSQQRSLPNVILPPLVEPPSYKTFAPPRISPFDVSYRDKDQLEFEKCPIPATYNHWQQIFKKKKNRSVFRVLPSSDAVSWVCEIEAVQNVDDLRTSQGNCIPTSRQWTPRSQRLER